jgi:hypothetical protein
MGAVDSLIVFRTQSSEDFSLKTLFGEVSALAIQVSSQSKISGGGLAFSLANFAREEYDEGWTEGTLPSPGGLFASLAFSGRLGGPEACIECWGSFGAGLLEPPGAAFSLCGEFECPWNPRHRLEVFSFVSLPGYRAWTGDPPEWDMALGAIMKASWDKVSAKIEGRVFSEPDTANRIDWMPAKATVGVDVKGFGFALSCEAAFSASDPIAASARLSREFEISAIPSGRIGLTLSAKMGDVDVYSAGLSLGWMFKATSSSAGKASMTICFEPESEDPSLSLSGAALQEIHLSRIGSMSLGIQSPDGGYVLGKTKPGLPDLSLSISLRFPQN